MQLACLTYRDSAVQLNRCRQAIQRVVVGVGAKVSQYAFQIARVKTKNVFLKKQVFFNSYFLKKSQQKKFKALFLSIGGV